MQKCHSIIITGKVQAEIAGIKEQTLSININLPENFTKASADDDIDIGRKLDKGNFLLNNMNVTLNNMNLDNKAGFNKLNTDLNAGFNNLTDLVSTFIVEQKVYNRGQQEHNTRLEAILEKLANK